MWDFYVGAAPRLYSFDPAKGLEQPVCELMTDVCAATVSPDGRTVLAQSYERPWGSPTRSWLVALGDGTRRELEGVFHPGWVGADADLLLRIRWAATPSGPAYDLLTAGGETRRQGSLPGGMMRLPFRLSPDGKKLAVLVSRRSVAGGEDLVRNDLLVLDVETGEQRMFEDFVRIYDPPSTYQTSDSQLVSSVVPLSATLRKKAPSGFWTLPPGRRARCLSPMSSAGRGTPSPGLPTGGCG